MKIGIVVLPIVLAINIAIAANAMAQNASGAVQQQQPAPQQAAQQQPKPPEPPKPQFTDCLLTGGTQEQKIDEVNGIRRINNLYAATKFLPTGSSVQLDLKDSLKSDVAYFSRLLEYNSEHKLVEVDFIPAHSVSAVIMPATHELVTKNNLATAKDTLITIDTPDTFSGLWKDVTVLVYTCEAEKEGLDRTPKAASALTMPGSSGKWTATFTLIGFLIAYALAAIATNLVDTKEANKNRTWWRYLDPVFMTAGSDGKGSLSKLQILFFTLIVFTLLAYIVMRTGLLSDLSTTILYLLGIAGLGSTAAKGADSAQNKLSLENQSWFIEKGWLPKDGLAALNTPKLRDLFTTDGEFDVYRYQNCIFGAVVGVALIGGGVAQLASFEIPSSVLQLLGLSQAMYVAGKVVSPPATAELNKSTDKVRDLEKNPPVAAPVAPVQGLVAGGQPPAGVAVLAATKVSATPQSDEYNKAVQSLRISFQSVTGR
jgi:hypothetical protein